MPDPTAPLLLLFPGLGADERVYGPQSSLPLNMHFARWIEPESNRESLGHYAERMAAQLPRHPNLYVGGISLGAMVALEVASHVGARGVILIGGCHSHEQISPLFNAVLAAASILPVSWVRPSLVVAPLAFKLFEGLSPEHNRLMTTVLREHSPAQTRWSAGAIRRWTCCVQPPPARVLSIHGENDEVIPLRNVRPTQVVRGGRHLINLSHPEQVNAFIMQCVTERADDPQKE